MAVIIQPKFDNEKFERLKDLAPGDIVFKTIRKAEGWAVSGIKRKAAKEITDRYNLTKKDFNGHVKVRLNDRKRDRLEIVFRGERMALATFAVDRGPPVQVHVKNGTKTMSDNVYVRDMWASVKKKRYAVMFEESRTELNSKGNPKLRSLHTIAIPQGIMDEGVSSKVTDYAANEIARAVNAAILKTLDEISKA